MELSVAFFALAIPAVLFAGVSKGGFGSGAAFAAAPLLALILPPEQAIGLMLPLLMLMDATALRIYWRRWDGRAAARLILGGLPGVVAAALVWRLVDAAMLRILIGLVALGFVAFRLARESGRLDLAGLPTGPVAGAGWGALAGFTSFISHAGGPPASVYLLSLELDKARYQATTVIVFWAVNLFKAVPYAMLGIFSTDTLEAALWLAPVAVAGIGLGARLHRLLPERVFFRLTYALLTLTGSKLIWDGLA